MKNRSQLLTSTAFSLAIIAVPAHVAAQTPSTDGKGGTGNIVTNDPTLSSTNGNILPSTSIGTAGTQTVFSGFRTAGGNGSGGGAGLGGVFFVDSGASLALTNVSFANNAVVGGQGGGVRVDPVAPFAFSIAGTSADASAYVQYNTGVNAANTTGEVQVNSLTLAKPNPLIGVGSGVGLVLSSSNLYPAYSSTVSSITSNSDGTVTLNLSKPIALGVSQGFTRATLSSDGKSWSFSSTNATDIQSGMAVVKANPNETIPDGLRVDQVTRDGNNQITAITLKNADGSPYTLGNDASVNVINGLTYDFSRVAVPASGSTLSKTLVSTGPLAGFSVGQALTINGVASSTTVKQVTSSFDTNTGDTITTVTLSDAIDLKTATKITAASSPVVAGSNNMVLSLASTAGLAVGQTISGPGIITGTKITAIGTTPVTLSNGTVVNLASASGLTVGQAYSGAGIPAGTTIASIGATQVTLSNALTQGAVNTIANSNLLVTVDPVVSSAAGSVKLTSVSGYRVGDALTGSSIPANAKIASIDSTTNTITYVIDNAIGTANSGGAMNSLVAPGTVGVNGTDGRTGTSYAATFDNGEGAPGSNAGSGGAGSGATGGNGGNGGSGSNGSVTNKTLITTLALDTASLAVDFLNTADDSAGIFTLPHVPGDIAAAVVDAAHVAFDTVQLTAWQLAEKEGLVALGGQGGQGGNGGAGTDFFGGGSGGSGGNGGNGAEPQSPVYSIGGAGGNGGNGGAAGFGAGGGNGGAAGTPGTNGANSGSNANGSGGAAGFGGGTGSSGGQGGEGGSGYGGAIFVRDGGKLTITGDSVFQNNAAFAGSSSNGGAAGSSAGGDLFMMQTATVTLAPGTGHTISFYDSIADDSSASIGGSIAAGQGAQLNITGGGTVQLFGTDTYTGATNISGATLEAQDGTGINPYSQIEFSGTGTIGNNLSSATAGVLLSGGTITRAIGTGPNNVNFAGSGGFAGTASNLLLNFGSLTANAGPTLKWGTNGFVPVGATLVFGSDAADATGTVTMQNAIDLGGNIGNIAVYHNAGEAASFDAAITGAIGNGQLNVGDTGYAGTLLLSGQNSLSGITLSNGTVSTINGAQVGRLMDPTNGGFVTVAGGTLQLGGPEKLTTVNVAAGGALLAASAIQAGTITNSGIAGFASTLGAASIANSGVLGLMGTTTVAGAITNAAGGTVRQLGATSAASVLNAGTWTLAADLTSPAVVDNGEIDVVGTVANGVETAATRTIHAATFGGAPAGTVNLGGITGNVANALVIDQSGNSTFAGVFKGAGSLTKTGAGTLTLTGASSFTGGLTIAAGTIDTTGGGTFADTLGIGVAQGATMIVGTADTVGAVTNAGTLNVKANYGVASLANSGTATSQATLTVAGNLANSGGLTLAGPLTRVGGAFVNGRTGTVSLGAASQFTVAGASSNDGQLTLGNGSLTHLGGTLTNTGTLTNRGTLIVDGQVGNAQGGIVNLIGGGSQFAALTNAGSFTATAPLLVTGAVANSGTMTLGAGATPRFGTLVNSGTITTAGPLLVAGGYEQDAGVLSAAGNVTTGSLSGAGGAIVLNGASQLSIGQAMDGTYAGSITGTGIVAKGGTATLTLAGGTGSIAPGALAVLSGGVVVQNAGALNGALAVAVAAPGTLTLAGDQSIASLANAGTVLLAADLTTGIIADDGTLVVTGAAPATRTLHTGAFTGGTTGVVQLGGIDGTAANMLVIDQSGNSTFAGTVTGAGNLVKAGAGALTLAGTNGFTGALAVNAGTLTLAAANAYGGATSIASGATLALTGTGSIAASSGVRDDGLFSIAGTTGGASIASLGGAGTVDLGAQRLTLTNAGDSFAGTIGGTGGLTIAAGTETLTGANTYTGTTIIAAPATLALTGGGTLASAAVVANGTFDISGTTAGTGIATLSGGGTVALGSQQLTLTNAGDTFAGTVTGAGGLTIAGGNETLTGVSGYTGRTIVGAGATLALAGGGTIAASSGVTDNGRFDISTTTAGASIASLSGNGSVGLGAQQLTLTAAGDTFAGTIDGSGSVAVAGGSELLGGANSYTGRTIVNVGATLGLSGTGAIETSSGVTDNGIFAIDQTANGARIATLSGNGAVALGAQRLTLTAAGDVFAGTIGGTGGLSVAAGTEVLTGASTYGGATAVAANAQLVLAGAGSIANSSTVAVDGLLDLSQAASGSIRSLAGAGTVALGGTTLQLTAAGDTFAGSIIGYGGVTVASGTETLTGVNGYAGQTVIASGATLALAGNGSIAASSGVTGNGTLDLSAVTGAITLTQLTGQGALTIGAGGLTISQATGTFSGAISGAGGLAITGGTQGLTGVNTYAGGTTVSHATLAIGGDGALGATGAGVTLDTATLRFLAATASNRGIAIAGPATFDTTGNAVALNGTIAGGGTLIAAGGGRLSLGGANSYADGTLVNGGTTLAIGSDAALGAAAGVLSIANGTLQASADLTTPRTILIGQQARFDSGGHVLGVTGTVYGQAGNGYDAIATGGFKLTGILDVAPAGSGFTLQSGSRLRGTGTFNRAMLVNGTLAPGNSPGTMTFTAPVTIAPGGALSIDIDGTGTGTGAGNYSRLVLTGGTGVFTAGGTLYPVLRGITGSATNSYTPALGQSFTIVQTPNAVNGSFAGIVQPAAGLAAGTRFDATYGNSVTLFVTPADYTNLSAQGITLTQNQQATGAGLNALRGTAGVRTDSQTNSQLGTIFSLSAADLQRFEDRVSGGIYSDVLRAASARTQNFGRLVDAQSALTTGGHGQVWLTGYGQDYDFGTSRQRRGLGYAGGAALQVADDTILGIAGGYDEGTLSHAPSGARADVDLTHVTLYGAFTGDHAYARLQAGATEARVTSTRAIAELGTTARGHTDGWGFAGSVEAGYIAHMGGWTLSPSLTVRSSQVRLDAFAETGGGVVALSVDKGRFDQVQGVATLHVARDVMVVPGMTLRPQLDLSYLHELGDVVGRTNEALAGASGTPIVIDSPANGRDGFRLGAGVTAQTASGVAIFARGAFDTQANVNTRSATVGLAYRW